MRNDTLHNRLIDRALSDGWKRPPWKPQLRKYLKEAPWHGDGSDQDEDSDEILALFGDLHCVPDAWRMRVESESEGWLHPVLAVEFLEVDVTSHCDDRKLIEYDTLWWRLDGTEMFHLRVFQMDRFGLVKPLVTEDTIYHILNYLYGSDSPRKAKNEKK
jgi:hypothetical protein